GERPPSPNVGIEFETAPSFEEIQDLTQRRREHREVAEEEEPKEYFEPNLYLYDAYPGGIGFSEPLFRVHDLLVAKTRELIAGCPCEKGCPSCVGPAGEKHEHAKEAALAVLDKLHGDE
ncbi:MAG: DUF1998 domain-containing protein, partial [Acidobacteria bacterium]|nr:DUF1998 domain-containing protein [Acidobacteriota bacterium]